MSIEVRRLSPETAALMARGDAALDDAAAIWARMAEAQRQLSALRGQHRAMGEADLAAMRRRFVAQLRREAAARRPG